MPEESEGPTVHEHEQVHDRARLTIKIYSGPDLSPRRKYPSLVIIVPVTAAKCIIFFPPHTLCHGLMSKAIVA